MAIVLRYVGDGSAWFPGAPMRDLDDAEVAERGLDIDVLVNTGLYVRPGAKAASGPAQNKLAQPAQEQKAQAE